MKKVLFVFILLFQVVMVWAGSIDSLTPADANLLLESSPVKNVIRISKKLINLMPPKQRAAMLKDLSEIKRETGIDFLNAYSLKKDAGIDINRKFGFAVLKKISHKDRMAFYLPVRNGKRFLQELQRSQAFF